MSWNPDEVRRVIQEESVLIDRQGIVALYEAAQKMMGLGLGGLLYRAGKLGGRQGAQLLAQRLQLQGEDLLQALVIAFNTARWGQARLERHAQPWTLYVENSLLGQHLKAKKPVCHPIAGYWAGFLEEALGRAVELREVRCMAMGHEACEFEVLFR